MYVCIYLCMYVTVAACVRVCMCVEREIAIENKTYMQEAGSVFGSNLLSRLPFRQVTFW